MKSKKLLLGSLSTMALVATPIAAVVSCGNDSSTAAEKFAVANYIKEIKKDDGGLELDTNQAGIGKLYISKADIAKGKTFKIGKSTITIPAATKAGTKVKVSITNDKGEESKTEVTPAAVTEGQYVFHKNQVVATLTEVTTNLAMALITTGGKGIYKFDFKADSLKVAEGAKAAKPALTDDAKKAFEKLFDDAGFTLTGLSFSAITTANVQVITPTFTLAKKTTTTGGGTGTNTGGNATGTVQGDLDALKAAIPATTATATTASGTTPIAIKAKAEIKAADAAMTSDALVTAINEFIKAGSTFLAKPSTLLDTLIKDDMAISAQITVAAGAASGELTLTFSKAGLNDTTTTIIITK